MEITLNLTTLKQVYSVPPAAAEPPKKESSSRQGSRPSFGRKIVDPGANLTTYVDPTHLKDDKLAAIYSARFAGSS